MDYKNLLKNYCLSVVCLIVCVQSSLINEENVTKSVAEKSWIYSDCSVCYSVNNMVCVDTFCYCKPNYELKYSESMKMYSYSCLYKSCSTDNDCIKTHDPMRHCSRGSCVCDKGYSEDYNNGRKCTYRVSVWAWVWVFFFIPAVALAIYIFIRRRRMHLAHTHAHVVHCPPPYTTGQQTVYRY